MAYRIGVVGATGNVGQEILSILAERSFPVSHVAAIASDRSVGSKVSFGDEDLPVEGLSSFDFSDLDLVFFAASTKLAEKYIPQITQKGTWVIDKSSAYRMDPAVPLLVPEVNADLLSSSSCKIVASPNCVTIPLVMTLKVLDTLAPIKRVVVSTYQSVSGAGREAMDELYRQTRALFVNDEIEVSHFAKQIAFNVIPCIDTPRKSGQTGEEEKIILELKKILRPSLKVAATAVRVPVFIGHAMSVNVEFEKGDVSPAEAREALAKSAGIMVLDRVEEDVYITPLETAGEDMVCVSRIRKDPSVACGLDLWVAADNLRKGAALNAVQIAEALHHQGRL